MNVLKRPMQALSVMTLALALAGCAGGPPARVLVPMPVNCKVDMPKKPVWATSTMAPDADIFVKVRALLVERRQRVTYEKLLEAAIAGCNTPTE